MSAHPTFPAACAIRLRQDYGGQASIMFSKTIDENSS